MLEQNFKNHVQRPLGFLILFLALFLTWIGAAVNLYQSWGDHQRLYSASLIFVLAGCAVMTPLYARTFALKAQDRAIHAEENLRHFVATGKPFDARLTLQQIIALRFASDAEYVQLTQKAAADAMAPNEIKRAVRNWRPDTHRV